MRGRKRALAALLAAAGVLGLALLTSSRQPLPESVGGKAAGPSASGGDAPAGGAQAQSAGGLQAPDFTLRLVGGGQYGLSERPGKVTVLFFVVPGCPSCTAEIPGLAQVQERYGARGVDVLVVNLDPSSFPDVFIEQYTREIGYPQLVWAMDEGASAARSYGVRSLGSTVILDAAGRVSYQDGGYTPSEVLEREVAKALGGG